MMQCLILAVGFTYSLFLTSLFTNAAPVEEERCGPWFGNISCSDGSCCSADGFCGGNRTDFCNRGCLSNCNSPLNKIQHCNQPRTVALTFDDGPSNYTDFLLDVLKAHNVKSTFFVVGQMITRDRYPIICRMVREGHTVASHTFTHPNMTNITDEEIIEELERNEDILVRLTGVKPKYFRPPYYEYDERVSKLVDLFNYRSVFSGIDSLDWKYQATEPEKIYELIINNLKGDSPIVLQHDIHKRSVDLVDRIIRKIKELGYRLVNLDECLCSY